MAIKLISPWMEYYHKIQAFFKKDSKVHVILSEDEKTIDLYVEDAAKADALAMMLPNEVKFGNVTMYVCVIPPNGEEAESTGDMYHDAFGTNEAFSFSRTVSGIMTNDITYVVFKNEVVQYYNDDLGDIYGQRSCLYENLAREIFTDAHGVYFCTDLPSWSTEECYNL